MYSEVMPGESHEMWCVIAPRGKCRVWVDAFQSANISVALEDSVSHIFNFVTSQYGSTVSHIFLRRST